MSFGTDAGVCPYGTSGKQFAFMVKYGMTPMQAIQAATRNAADLLGHSNEVGSIKPGKVCRHRRSHRRPAYGYSSAGKCAVRDEKRRRIYKQ